MLLPLEMKTLSTRKRNTLKKNLLEMSVHALSFLNEEENIQLPNKQIYTHVATPTHSSAEGVYDVILNKRRRTDSHIEEIPDDSVEYDENVVPELKLVNVLENLNKT